MFNKCASHMQVWFEVSAHTSRVHFHGSDDGTALLGLSMPMGMLQGTTLSASLQDLLHALETRYACLLLVSICVLRQAAIPVCCKALTFAIAISLSSLYCTENCK